MHKNKKIVIALIAIVLMVPTLMFSGSRYFLNRGVEIMDNNREEARDYFKKAANFNPFSGNPEAYKALTYHQGVDLSELIHKKDVEEAISNYEKSIDKIITPTKSYKNLGEIYYHQAKYYTYINEEDSAYSYGEKADNYLQVAVEKKPTARIYYLLGYLHALTFENLEEAERFYQEGKSINPDYKWFDFGMGYILANRGECSKALTLLNAEELSPEKDITPYLYLAKGYCRSRVEDNLAAGIDDYLKAIEIKPDYTTALYNLANAYDYIGADLVAKEYLKRLIEADDKNIYEEGINNHLSHLLD